MALVAGQKLRVSDLTGSGSAVGGGSVFMASDVTVNNTTTLTDATGLSIAVVPGTYKLESWLRYNGGSTPDLKIQPSAPSGSTGHWSLIGLGRDSAPVIDVGDGLTMAVVDIGTSLTVSGDSTGTMLLSARADGYFVVTTAGTFKLRVAQRTATASNTVLRAGSWMTVTRMA